MEFSRQEYWSGLPFLTDVREANYKDSDKYFHSQGTMMLPKGDQGAPGLLKWPGTRDAGNAGMVEQSSAALENMKGPGPGELPLGLWALLLLPTLLLCVQCEVWVAEEQNEAGGNSDAQPSPYESYSPSTGLSWAEVCWLRVLAPLSLVPLRVIDSLGRGEMGSVQLWLISPGLISSPRFSIPVMPERMLRESQACVSMETVATGGRTRGPTSLPMNGAGAAKTPITADLLASLWPVLSCTELPLTLCRVGLWAPREQGWYRTKLLHSVSAVLDSV